MNRSFSKTGKKDFLVSFSLMCKVNPIPDPLIFIREFLTALAIFQSFLSRFACQINQNVSYSLARILKHHKL